MLSSEKLLLIWRTSIQKTIMKTIITLVILGVVTLGYAQENEKISTMDFVQIVDGNKEALGRVCEVIYDHEYTETKVKSLISLYDLPTLGDHEAMAIQFVNVRSFAVNTMRHGAPLAREL